MSLILDALSRARDDANPMPGIATHHSAVPMAANRRQYLLWVALSVAVVAIAWLIVERYSAPPFPVEERSVESAQPLVEPAKPPVESVQSPVESTQPLVAPAQPPVESAQPLVEGAQTAAVPEVAAQASPLGAVSPEESQGLATESSTVSSPTEFAEAVESSDAASLVPEHAEPAQSVAPQEDDAVAELYRNPPVAEEPPIRKPAPQTGSAAQQYDTRADAANRAAEPIDVDKLLRQAREEVANDSLSDHPVPFLIDLSQQTKDSIPTLHYLRHNYSNDPSQSTVVLNSKTLSVGGSPSPGMKIEEILPDSVVLNYQGTQFRLRALNSWVNL